MIDKNELTRIARNKGFRPDIIEKDYALTWTLKAIYANPKLSKYLVFKGGTCISKVYAETYRLSEDLDFTAYEDGKLSNEELEQELTKAFVSATRGGGPVLEIIKGAGYQNPGMVQFFVRYIGPLNHPGRLKLELSLNERLAFEPVQKELKERAYPDISPFKVNCYDLVEIKAEKLRAIMQRGKTRDYYDVWQMTASKSLAKGDLHGPDALRSIMKEKCDRNGIVYEPELMFSEARLKEAEGAWEHGLGRLVKELPEFKTVIEELKKIFWAEEELALFETDLGFEHLRNLRRDESTELLLVRGAALLFQRLDSSKAAEVEKALDVLIKAYTEIPEIKPYRFGPEDRIMRLAQDKDPEIKQKAKNLLKLLLEKQ